MFKNKNAIDYMGDSLKNNFIILSIVSYKCIMTHKYTKNLFVKNKLN